MKVLYVYKTERKRIYEDFLNGKGPNNLLFGLNYMKEHSINASFFDYNQESYLKKTLSPLEKITLLNITQSIKLSSSFDRNDIIFSTSDACGLGLSIIRRFKRSRVPQVYQTIGLKYSRFTNLPVWMILRNAKIYRCILSNVNKIVYVTSSEKDFLINFLKLPEDKLKRINFGIDTDYFYPIKKDGGFILSVGRDNNRDYRTLIDSITDEDIKIICSKRNIHGIKIPKNIDIYFDLSIDRIRKFYSESRFVVLPVNDVNYSCGQTAMLEAMAMGKAVIASKSKGLYHSMKLENYKHCIFVRVGDPKDLKEKIQYLLKNPKEAKRIGKEARKIVEKKYNIKNYAKELSDIFWEIYNK